MDCCGGLREVGVCGLGGGGAALRVGWSEFSWPAPYTEPHLQPRGSGTAVEVAAEEVAWPRQPAAEVGGCTTSPWGSRATWRGVRARLALWCGLGLRCRRLLPVVFAGWVGLDATEAEVAAARPRLVMQCRASPAAGYGSVAEAPKWVNVGGRSSRGRSQRPCGVSSLSLRVLRLTHRRFHRASHRGGGPRRRLDAEPPAGRRVG